jgi:hypothetical protein
MAGGETVGGSSGFTKVGGRPGFTSYTVFIGVTIFMYDKATAEENPASVQLGKPKPKPL